MAKNRPYTIVSLALALLLALPLPAARNFQSTDRVVVSSAASVMDSNTASILCQFKASTATGANRRIYSEFNASNEQVFLRITTTEVLILFWRTPTAIVNITGTTTVNDNAWHRVLAVRRADNDFELFLDEASEGTDTNAPGTISTITEILWGNRGEGAYNEDLDGDLARCMTFEVALSPDEAKGILLGIGTRASRWPPEQWIEMWGFSPEPDLSGNGRNGTVTDTTVTDHCPCGPYR